MGLPRTPQPLIKWIKFHDLSRRQVADACTGGSTIRLNNICNGMAFPSPDEIDAFEALFKHPITVLLDPCLSVYRDGPWPVPRGTALFMHEQKLREQGVRVDPTPGFFETQLSGLRVVRENGE